MKVTELRIGNIVQDRDKKKAVVEELSKEDGIKAFSGMITGLPLGSIPLTDVWLIKFGFHYDLDRCEFFKEFNKSALYIDSDYTVFIAGDEVCQLSNVHQLQNLYFALTGKELQYSAL